MDSLFFLIVMISLHLSLAFIVANKKLMYPLSRYISKKHQLQLLADKVSINTEVAVDFQRQRGRSLFKIELDDNNHITGELFQETTGNVPRSYLPTQLWLYLNDLEGVIEAEDVVKVLNKVLIWYLDRGGKIQNLTVLTDQSNIGMLDLKRFKLFNLFKCNEKDGNCEYKIDIEKAITFYESELKNGSFDKFVSCNILGRLYHELGMPSKSINFYTDALIAQPRSSATFRNLGAAYTALGQKKMAFASFQQAVELDPTGKI